MPELDTQHTQLIIIVRTLLREYDWQLLSERQVQDAVLPHLAVVPTPTPAQLRTLAIKEYSRLGVYPACLGLLDAPERKQGFEELWRYLQRAAHYKWPEMAQEMAQETVVTLHSKIHDCRKPEMFLFFAYQKLCDTAKKWQRRATKERSLDQLLEEDIYGDLDAAKSLTGGEEPPMEESVVQAELWHQARQALRRVRQAQPRASRQLDAVWLRYMQEMSLEECAARLETSVANVSVLINRGLGQLRQDPEFTRMIEELARLQ